MIRFLVPQRGERLFALVALLVVLSLNALVVAAYWPALSVVGADYHTLARDTMHVSGFDAWSYSVVSEWSGWQFNIYRHPLLALMMWPLYAVNQGLIALTGVNCAVPLVALLETVSGFYAALLLWRTLTRVMRLPSGEAWLLSAFFFSLAYVMLAVMVPDHFGLTLSLMMLALYLVGRQMARGAAMRTWQTVTLFFLTAGISLNNGLKIFVAALFSRGRRFFCWRYLLLAVVLPAAALWGIASWEHAAWAAPLEQAAQQRLQEQRDSVKRAVYMAYKDTCQTQDDGQVRRGVNRILRRMAQEKYRQNHTNQKIGDPMSKKGFMAWTDASTDRWQSIVENLFGESLQLHPNHLLEDILKDSRPMIVPYTAWYYYAVEAVIAVLFVLGLWRGRRESLLWLVSLWWLMDMGIHVVLGFGINEVYIMTAQWAVVLPVALACLLRSLEGRRRTAVAAVILLLTLWLATHNGGLTLTYMLGQ